jgi:signal peptidase I
VTAVAAAATHEPLSVRLSRALLTRAVRGGAAEGTMWGEALLGEFDEASSTSGEAVRWAVSSLPVAWRERRKRRSAARAAQTLRVRVTRRAVISLAILLVGGIVVNAFVATIGVESSTSMAPTYAVGSRILFDKIGYHVTGLHRGDIVSVRVPHAAGLGGEVTMIKRVVGLPGDVMSCTATGALTRDGVVVAGPTGAAPAPGEAACRTVTVPVGDVYLVGDNYVSSADSRLFGPVPESGVTARAVGRVWPW